MMKAVVLGVTLVGANLVSTLILMKVCMSKWFLKKTYKMTFEMMSEMENMDLDSDKEMKL
jgi:hypothetical protein